MTRDEFLEIYPAMRKYGGSFVQALAECFIYADNINFALLSVTFPEIIDEYRRMADLDKKKETAS
jgi:hypothetical protein